MRHSKADRATQALSAMVQMISSGEATTRIDLARNTGLAASTITLRVGQLLDAGILAESGQGDSRGGRKPSTLLVNSGAGTLLTASIGATACRFALTDLAARVISSEVVDCDLDDGPVSVLGRVAEGFQKLIADSGPLPRVVGIAIGVPGPVDTLAGRVRRPPMMAGWDDYPIAEVFATPFPGIPVLVNNDANVMALGEYWARQQKPEHLMFIKVGTGIGCGIVSHGHVHVGANGAAGDIGHVRVPGHDDVRCSCGKSGCVTAVASGKAIAQQLRAMGLEVRNSHDVAKLVLAGNLDARHAVRVAAQEIGNVVATMVSLYNPGHIVIGGLFGHLADDMLTDIRSAVYHYAQPLATHSLKIEQSILADEAGIVGAAVMGAQYLFSPEGIQRLMDPQFQPAPTE